MKLCIFCMNAVIEMHVIHIRHLSFFQQQENDYYQLHLQKYRASLAT